MQLDVGFATAKTAVAVLRHSRVAYQSSYSGIKAVMRRYPMLALNFISIQYTNIGYLPIPVHAVTHFVCFCTSNGAILNPFFRGKERNPPFTSISVPQHHLA